MEKGFLLWIRFKASYFASLTRACRIRAPAALAPRRIVAASLAFAGGAEAHLVDAWRGINIDCCRRRLGMELVIVQTRLVIPEVWTIATRHVGMLFFPQPVIGSSFSTRPGEG